MLCYVDNTEFSMNLKPNSFILNVVLFLSVCACLYKAGEHVYNVGVAQGKSECYPIKPNKKK